MTEQFQPKAFLKYLNPDGGMPYAPGTPSFSESTLLMILAFIAAEDVYPAQPLVEWIIKNRNADGSIGLNSEFPHEGLWNTPLMSIVMHHLGFQIERDAAINFTLGFRSLTIARTADNDLDTLLVGWPWVSHAFGWVEPTSWALLSLKFAGMDDHPRAIEGRRLLIDRCLPQGGWNYGNKVVFNHSLMPFWETTALALLALGDSSRDLINKNLDMLESSLPEVHSLFSNALVCLSLARFGRNTEGIRNRIGTMLSDLESKNLNFAHSAMGGIALSRKKVLTP